MYYDELEIGMTVAYLSRAGIVLTKQLYPRVDFGDEVRRVGINKLVPLESPERLREIRKRNREERERKDKEFLEKWLALVRKFP